MWAVANASHIPTSLTWVRENITADENDPQLQTHIDTFHSAVKMWVCQRGEVTVENRNLKDTFQVIISYV